MLVTAEGNLENTVLILYDPLFPNKFGTTKFGKVVSVEKSSSGPGGDVLLQLESGENVPFRYLILSTGSLWDGPFTSLGGNKEDLLSDINERREKTRKSEAIAIFGADSVGLEFAGEFRDIYTDKGIAIINAGPLPLNVYPDNFRKGVLRRWSKRGIKFVLEDRLDEVPDSESSTVTTSKGQKVNADLVLLARGPRPNTEFLRSLGDDILDGRGFVKVTPTLEVQSYPDIFAARDITELKKQKQLAKLPGQVAVIIANLLSLVASKEPRKKYQGTIAITNGKDHGAGYVGALWGVTLGDTLVPMLKGRELFVRQRRAALGLKV